MAGDRLEGKERGRKEESGAHLAHKGGVNALPRFRAVLTAAGLDARVVDACAVHFALVLKWNPTHNLTRLTDEEDAAVLHYLDCALPLLSLAEADGADPDGAGVAFADIGSGAGFPGLVAAILWPRARVTLVEPARKRASFLTIAAGELGLRTVTVTAPPASAPTLAAAASAYPLVLSRATFSSGVRSSLWPYVAAGGRLCVWSSSRERSTWEKEAATWSPRSITWSPYTLPTLPRGSTVGEARSHGVIVVHRS